MTEDVPTKERILDSAERLFGARGFEATSLRDITADANVNLAAVNYYFQTKESLIHAVIARRLGPVNRRRLEMLDAAGPNPTIEQILTAFIQPPLECELAPVLPLMGKVLADPQNFKETIFPQHFSEVAARFHDAFVQAMPHLQEPEVVWRMHFAIGTMTHILNWSKLLPSLTEGLCSTDDRKALIDRAVQFLAAGFRS